MSGGGSYTLQAEISSSGVHLYHHAKLNWRQSPQSLKIQIHCLIWRWRNVTVSMGSMECLTTIAYTGMPVVS